MANQVVTGPAVPFPVRAALAVGKEVKSSGRCIFCGSEIYTSFVVLQIVRHSGWIVRAHDSCFRAVEGARGASGEQASV